MPVFVRQMDLGMVTGDLFGERGAAEGINSRKTGGRGERRQK